MNTRIIATFSGIKRILNAKDLKQEIKEELLKFTSEQNIFLSIALLEI